VHSVAVIIELPGELNSTTPELRRGAEGAARTPSRGLSRKR
jgi:hypothetical protein